jgi:hypothetical protein
MAAEEIMTSLTADEVLDATKAFREHFGVEPDPREEPALFEEAIQEVDPRFKGDRKYIDVVRFQLEDDTTAFTEQDEKVIMRAAGVLDMLAPRTPLVGEFDIIAGTAAARMEPWRRLEFAAKAKQSGEATGRLVGVASTRLLNPGEVAAAASYAPEDAQTEADLERAAVQKIEEEYGLEVVSIIVDNPRAHNAMILDAIVQAFPEARRIAAVTTQIYQVRTSLDFARQGALHDVTTAVAGNPSDKTIVANRTTATYQSEVAGAQRAAAKHFL